VVLQVFESLAYEPLETSVPPLESLGAAVNTAKNSVVESIKAVAPEHAVDVGIPKIIP
jgi:hypothetical protein